MYRCDSIHAFSTKDAKHTFINIQKQITKTLSNEYQKKNEKEKLEGFADKIIDCHLLTCVNYAVFALKMLIVWKRRDETWRMKKQKKIMTLMVERMLERKSVQFAFCPVCTAIRPSGLDSIVFSGNVFFFSLFVHSIDAKSLELCVFGLLFTPNWLRSDNELQTLAEFQIQIIIIVIWWLLIRTFLYSSNE